MVVPDGEDFEVDTTEDRTWDLTLSGLTVYDTPQLIFEECLEIIRLEISSFSLKLEIAKFKILLQIYMWFASSSAVKMWIGLNVVILEVRPVAIGVTHAAEERSGKNRHEARKIKSESSNISLFKFCKTSKFRALPCSFLRISPLLAKIPGVMKCQKNRYFFWGENNILPYGKLMISVKCYFQKKSITKIHMIKNTIYFRTSTHHYNTN